MITPHRIKLRKIALILTSVITLTLLTGFDWSQFNANPEHSGTNTQETLITAANVASLSQLFKVTLPDRADGPPVFLQFASTISGTRDVVFLTSVSGHIVALD